MKTTKRLLITVTLMSAFCALLESVLAVQAKWILYVRSEDASQRYPNFIPKMNFVFYSNLLGSAWFIVMTTLLVLAMRRLRDSK
jgi:hypothetical protein